MLYIDVVHTWLRLIPVCICWNLSGQKVDSKLKNDQAFDQNLEEEAHSKIKLCDNSTQTDSTFSPNSPETEAPNTDIDEGVYSMSPHESLRKISMESVPEEYYQNLYDDDYSDFNIDNPDKNACLNEENEDE